MVETLSRKELRERIQSILSKPMTDKMSYDEKGAVENLLAAANEMRQAQKSPSYIDEKMGKAVRDICSEMDDEPTICKTDAKDVRR